MGRQIRLASADGHEFGGYRAEPDQEPRAAVVVIGEVWGVNHWVRSVADDYARHGYLSIAPALFDRIRPGFESEDYSPEYFQSVGALMKGFDLDKALDDIAATVAEAARVGQVGITGFCFGGAMTWRAAARGMGLTAGSGYYGGGIPRYIDLDPLIPLQMHYGAKDQGIPLDQIEELKRRHPDVEVHTYDAGHGFCNSDAPRWVPEACRTARERSLRFLATHLA